MDKEEDKQVISIYEYFNTSQKQWILLSVSCLALLTPFSDTMYLPALPNITSSLHTTDTMASLTISTYLAAVGIGQVCWGPLTDHYGRIQILYCGIILFLLFSIGCLLSDSIITLIILRTCQGLIVGSTLITGQAVVNDIFPIEELGTAMGKFMIPMLVGPIIAPLIGGALSQQFGWRSTFVLLGIMTIPFLMLTYFVVPETHPWFLIQALDQQGNQRKHKTLNIQIKDKEKITRPPLISPIETLLLMFDPQITIFLASEVSIFSIVFVSLTLLPIKLAESPYNMSQQMVGITYIASGIGTLIGSLLGGILSDRSAAKYPQIPEARMASSIIPLLIGCGAGIAFGYTLEAGIYVIVPLICQFFLGFGNSFIMTTTMGYLASCYPQTAGGIVSVMFSLSFMMSAILIAISVSISNAIGMGNLFVILCGFTFVLSIMLTNRIYSRINQGIAKISSTIQMKEVQIKEQKQTITFNTSEDMI